MALPPCISKCSPAQVPPVHRSQVCARRYLSSANGWGSSSLWALSYQCPYLGCKRSSMGTVLAMEGKKQAAQGGENKRREVKFNSSDLMELEFGRLLGEPHQETLAKVLGRKVNPEVSYIDIEKRPLKKIQKATGTGFPETEISRLLNQEGKPEPQPPNVIKPAARNSVAEKFEDLPGLVAPPARPGVGLSETDFSRLLNQEGSSALLPPRVAERTVQNSTAEKSVNLPDLISPPPRLGVRVSQAPRPTTAVKSGNSASTAQGKKAVPMVTFGPGGFAAQSRRQKAEDDYMGLVRKPAIGSEDSYTPSWPTNEIIPPMLIGKSKQSGDDKSDALLRRPTVSERSLLGASSGIVDTNRQGGAKVPSVAAKPVFGKRIKNSHVKAPEVDVPSFDMSDERFARLLELAGTSDAEKDQDGLSESTTAPTSGSVYTTSRKKPLPNLGSKPVLVVKVPSRPLERKEGYEEAGQSSVCTSSSEEFREPSDCFPAVDQEVTMLRREMKPTISIGRNEMATSEKRPVPLNAQKPIPGPSSPSKSTAEVTKPYPEMAMSEREIESTVNTSSKEISTAARKQPTVAQRPTLRPSNVVVSSTSPLEVDEASMSSLSREEISQSSISSPLVDVEISTLEREKEPTVSALDKEVLFSAMRAAPAIQKPILRPSLPSAPSSSNKSSETNSADRLRSSSDHDSALPQSTSSTSSVVQSAALLATASGVEHQLISKLEQRAEEDVIPKGLGEATRTDNVLVPVNRPVLRLAKTVSLVTPVRLQTASVPSKPSPLVSDPVKSEDLSSQGDTVSDRKSKNLIATEFGEPGDFKLGDTDRSTRRSEEIEAAVGKSEAALQQEEQKTATESEYDLSLQQQKLNETLNLLKRPVPPPAPSSTPLPSPLNDIMRQLSAARPAVNASRVKTNDSPAVQLQKAEAVLLDKKETPSKEEEDQDWARAEALLESKMIEEVVFAASNAGGMLVSFGSLVGFVPSWELSGKRRPPSFTTWAQENGSVHDEAERMKLLQQYREYRASCLAALVGETAKVMVIGIERERRQLRLSEKVAEGEGQELAQKKALLMASLNVGDIVTCTVKRVTNFGAFVELQGVPALIHISELSWNRITDPTTVLSVGQEVETKVCRLDRFLQRINLSFKQMQPDPLRETLESLVSNDGDEDVVDLGAGRDDGQEEIVEDIVELRGVIKRLEACKGIESVRKGRRIQGTALAPTFQVYLSAQLTNGYKLLARSGNQVQEVLVQTALDRDSMKDAIRDCTFSED